MDLSGKTIIITGASHGFGKAIALGCVESGANVLLCARGEEALAVTAAEVRAKALPGAQVLSQAADVSEESDVTALLAVAKSNFTRIDGLVNNAGVYGPKGRLEDVSWKDWARAIEINLFGTAIPCRAVLPLFRAQGHGKIVNLSGGGATAPLPNISSYAAAKAAVVRLTETLAHELVGTGIDVNAVAPGALNTRLLDELLEAGPEAVGRPFFERALKQRDTGGAPLAKGVDLVKFLLSDESRGISGRLISAIWDPWQRLPELQAALAESDIYTLRRIVPADRGKDWDKS